MAARKAQAKFKIKEKEAEGLEAQIYALEIQLETETSVREAVQVQLHQAQSLADAASREQEVRKIRAQAFQSLKIKTSTASLRATTFPSLFRMPVLLPCNGTTDPVVHLSYFSIAMKVAQADADELKCQAFPPLWPGFEVVSRVDSSVRRLLF